MPYWSVLCIYCQGLIVDALLECVPSAKQREPAFKLLFNAKPGAALACPYCSGLIGFNISGNPQVPESGWPVFRYGKAEMEAKMQSDGEPPTTPLPDWALKHRLTQPGIHAPLVTYSYAEHAPPNETVP
jgi:hypothetical protein